MRLRKKKELRKTKKLNGQKNKNLEIGYDIEKACKKFGEMTIDKRKESRKQASEERRKQANEERRKPKVLVKNSLFEGKLSSLKSSESKLKSSNDDDNLDVCPAPKNVLADMILHKVFQMPEKDFATSLWQELHGSVLLSYVAMIKKYTTFAIMDKHRYNEKMKGKHKMSAEAYYSNVFKKHTKQSLKSKRPFLKLMGKLNQFYKKVQNQPFDEKWIEELQKILMSTPYNILHRTYVGLKI